ncbi:metallophosphoesterase [Ramlibacter pallidus]|uniref:Metallophosphoesterase n=1 Tax=Ramlibacter pallidus TaxID=2780087 RepID=A0ABR9S044_9BURK|nr:metallophosphoesterase [Ramlibacter pallidus]MBE7366871.1 metallophosphoesterase [Ramlibacter pallidus]
MSLATLFAFSAVLHLYIGARLLPDLGSTPAGIAFGAVLVASALLVPSGMVARRLLQPPWTDRLVWVGMVALGLFSSLFVLTLLRDVSLLVAGLAGLDSAGWRRASAAGVPLAALASTAIGFFNARRTAAVRRVRIPLAGLDPRLEGLRIVQISDIHVGPTIKHGYLQKIVDRVNALQPDIVAVTGDLVDGSVPELREHVAPLAQLRARHGVYFVTGNHEYYAGVHAWVQEVQRLGLRVLHNEHVVLRHGDAPLVLAGVTDFTGGHFDAGHRSDPEAALRGAPAGAARVLLAHQPRSAAAAAAAGFDLQVSGHTHGGQFFPWSFFVPLQQPYTAGLHQLGRLKVYVSRGTGYWGPPKRFGAPSEISELLLSREG